MRVSINLTSYSFDAATGSIATHLRELAEAADEAGVDTVWVADHLLQADPGLDVDDPMLESFATLAHLAALTTRVRLGTMVAAATHRAPALLVKSVTTLDVLSQGRAWLGIGAGYQADEARAMGLDLPSVAERFERLEETLDIATRMFDGLSEPYAGQHYQLGRPTNSPAPVSRPGPPILVGGAGERRTLRLVARYADACNLFDVPDDGRTIRHKLGVLAAHCDDLGRDLARIDKTVSTRFEPGDTPSDLARRCEALAGYGATHVVLMRSAPWTPAEVTRLAEWPHVAA